MTRAWMEASSAETSSSQIISFGSTASVRAIPMHWRSPPEHSSRIAAHVIRLQANGLEQIDYSFLELTA